MSYYRGPRGFKPTSYGGQAQRAQYSTQKRSARRRRAVASARKPMYVVPMEKKGMDTDIITAGATVKATTNTNDDITIINLIRAGTGYFNRIGRKSHSVSVRLFGTVSCAYIHETTTGILQSNCLRQVVVWDKQPTGVLPVFDAIFGTTDQAGTESTQYLDPLKYDNMDRFQILRDTKYVMNPLTENQQGGTADSVNQVFVVDEFIKLNNRESVYSGDSSPMTISDISSGALYVIYRAEIDGPTNTAWTVDPSCFARLRYND